MNYYKLYCFITLALINLSIGLLIKKKDSKSNVSTLNFISFGLCLGVILEEILNN